MNLKIDKEFSNELDLWQVKVSGDVDIESAPSLKDELIGLVNEKNRTVEIDAEDLHYIDSTGLGILIGVIKKLKEEENDLVFVRPRDNVMKLFRITGLDSIFVIREE